MPLQERFLGLGGERDVERLARVRQPHHEHPQLDHHTGDGRVELTEIDLGLRARRMRLRHHHLDPVQAQLTPAARDITRHRHLSQRRPCSATSRCHTRRAVCRCLRGTSRSPNSQESITSTYASIAGRERRAYALRAGGTALASACRTVRRCTRCLSANSRIDRCSTRLSRLICSNSSTLDRTIPDLHADNINMKIRTQGGANIRDDTPSHRPARSPPRRSQNS